MARRRCSLNEELKAEFPFLKKRPKLSDADVTCKICNANFSLANSGKGQVDQHLKTVKHRKAIAATTKNSKVTAFCRKVIPSNDELELARKEGTFAFHTIKHTKNKYT